MIFATVGTHEDPFDRLIAELDRLKAAGELSEDVMIQSGYSIFRPTHCTAESLMGFPRVQALMAEARIIITHGGPASIMKALAHDKVPIVVPRQSAFGEHVDDHQVRFARKIANRVVVVLDIKELGPAIREHATRVSTLAAGSFGAERARAFALRFDALCGDLLAGRDTVEGA